MARQEDEDIYAKVFNKLSLKKLTEFRKIRDIEIEDKDLTIPASLKNREFTDKKGFLIYGIAIIIFVLAIWFGSSYTSDIRRLFYYADNCGNFCGVDNAVISGVSCSGLDHRHRRYFYDGDCQEVCHDQSCFLQRIPENGDMWKYFLKSWWKLLINALVTIVLCSVVLYFLTFRPVCFVWICTFITLAIAVAITIITWKFLSSGRVLFAIFVTVAMVPSYMTIFCFGTEIKIIALLLKEVLKTIVRMPKILLICVIVLLLQCFLLCFFTIWALPLIASKERDTSGAFEAFTFTKLILFLFVLFMTNWTMHIIAGLQCMITAGRVAMWYFAENNSQLDSPLCKSFLNAHCHIGTIICASFLQPGLTVLRKVIKSTAVLNIFGVKDVFLKWDTVTQYLLPKDAYVITALHGQPYLKSGKRAFNLLIFKAPSFVGLKSRTADVVLLMIQFNLVVMSVGFSYLCFFQNDKNWLPVIICLFISVLIVVVLFDTLEIITRTLLLSFAEDKFINGELTRPHTLTTEGLKYIFKKSEKSYAKVELRHITWDQTAFYNPQLF